MRLIKLTVPIDMPQLPGHAAEQLTDGRLGSVRVEIATRSVGYDTCLCAAAGSIPVGTSGDVIQYDQLDAAGKLVVDAMLDLCLAHAQASNHIPAGDIEAEA